MKPSLTAFVLCVFLSCAGQVWANTLPDSCGDDNVKFDVKTGAGQPEPRQKRARHRSSLSKTKTDRSAPSCMPQSVSVWMEPG